MDWQPIETAPKDGPGILAYIPSAPWHDEPHICEAFWSLWREGGGWRISDHDNGCWVEPTHWMPLPTPPKETPE